MDRLLLTMAALGIALCCVTGCAGVAGAIAGNLIDDLIDGGGGNPAVPTSLQGTWRQIAGTAGGTPIVVTGVNTIAFHANGTYRREWSEGPATWEQGTVTVSGSTLACRVTSSGDISTINRVSTATYQILGSTLTLTFSADGVIQTESFIRS